MVHTRHLALQFIIVSSSLFGCSKANSQELPWHLGVSSKSEQVASSAINTTHLKPGANEIVIALIDSGVIANHPSLDGRLLPGYDMTSSPGNPRGGRSFDYSPDPRDTKCEQNTNSTQFRTHGTEIASLIVGNGENGVFGVNPSAKLLPIRVQGSCRISRSDVLDAIAWSVGLPVPDAPTNPNPARLINLSFSGGRFTCGQDLQNLLDLLLERNVFVVAAAGNTFGKKLTEPANCRGVISVGAVDAENNIQDYSALDPRTTIYAPGGGNRIDGFQPWSVNKLKVATFELSFIGDEVPTVAFGGVGTSYAAPLVSGFISLLLSHNSELTPSEFITQLPTFSRPVNTSEKCADCKPRSLTMEFAN
jgi:serine protease